MKAQSDVSRVRRGLGCRRGIEKEGEVAMLILTYIERRKDVDNVGRTSGVIILTSYM